MMILNELANYNSCIMVLSNEIDTYIKNSLINGKLCKWEKSQVTVYTSPITAIGADKSFMYSLVEKSIQNWNSHLRANGINVQFQPVSQPAMADIVVHWVKVGRVFEGMCKYVSVINGEIRKISIDIGLHNELSPKNITDLSIYCTIMHEFGHALGLGHGVDIDDIMFVPHKKNISVPSENDFYVLKQIYQ